MKGAFLIKKYSMHKSNARFTAAGLTGAALAYGNKEFREKLQTTLAGPLTSHECATAEEQAADLEKIFKESGGMMSQEELMELVMSRKNRL